MLSDFYTKGKASIVDEQGQMNEKPKKYIIHVAVIKHF
jgi:hypothetical protein